MKTVSEDNDLMIINRSGMTIRMSVSDIRVAGRATQGVKLINLRGTDSIAAVSVVAKSEEEGDAGQEAGAEAETPATE
jgi:DNA gyrase subunit A